MAKDVDLDKHLRLKRKVDDLRRERDRAQGSFDQLMSRLAKDEGVGSVEALEQLEAKVTKESERLAREYEKELASLEHEPWYEELVK